LQPIPWAFGRRLVRAFVPCRPLISQDTRNTVALRISASKRYIEPVINGDREMAENDLASDLLYGAPAIGAFLGLSATQAYRLLEAGKLPGFKLKEKKWQARKSTLLRHIESLEQQTA
jgi:hypothetical protein